MARDERKTCSKRERQINREREIRRSNRRERKVTKKTMRSEINKSETG